MALLRKSIFSGTSSGALTFGASILALAYTNAFGMPCGFPLLVLDAVVVFGIGATLVAFLVHFLSVRTISASSLPVLLAFATTVLVAVAASGLLTHGCKAISAWSRRRAFGIGVLPLASPGRRPNAFSAARLGLIGLLDRLSHPEVDVTPIHEAFRRYRGFAAFGAWFG